MKKFVGIDVAKFTHYACVTDAANKILVEPFSFTNDLDGFQNLKKKIRKYVTKDVVVGLEATSKYGDNLIAYLSENGYSIALINPIQTSGIRRKQVRNTKTDKVDSKIICQYLIQNDYRLLKREELSTLELRSLCRFRQTLKKSNARLKTQIVHCLDSVFPEYHTLFSTVHGKGSYAVLRQFPSSSEIAKADVRTLSTLLREASRGHFNRAKAEELKALAQKSVGMKSYDSGFALRNSIDQVTLIEAQLNELEKRIEEMFFAMNSVLQTVPGIGALNGAMILSEIGDIKRFSNPNQLIAFAGLDPTVRQSGTFRADSGKMSKRGSPVLRYALVNAAWNVSLNNDTFKTYYEEKLSQKTGHYKALGHVAGKLCRVIFKMLKDNVTFNLP
jgi:transposase